MCLTVLWRKLHRHPQPVLPMEYFDLKGNRLTLPLPTFDSYIFYNPSTDEWTVLFAKLNHPRNNIATKTQYEVKLNMKMDKNSVERSNLEYALEKYDQIKQKK